MAETIQEYVDKTDLARIIETCTATSAKIMRHDCFSNAFLEGPLICGILFEHMNVHSDVYPLILGQLDLTKSRGSRILYGNTFLDNVGVRRLIEELTNACVKARPDYPLPFIAEDVSVRFPDEYRQVLNLIKGSAQTESKGDLAALLSELHLDKFAAKMKEEGAETVSDLVELSAEELAEFCSGAGMNAVQRNKLSKALVVSATAKNNVILNEPGKWDFFLSHTQRDGEAKMLAELLYYELTGRGLSVWLDVKMKVCDAASMEEGARNSKVCIPIITDNKKDSYFSREMCRNELKWALRAGNKVVPVVRAEDKPRIGAFVAEGEKCGIELGNKNFVHIDRGSQRMLKASLEVMLEQAGML